MPYFSKYNPDCTSKYEDPLDIEDHKKVIKKNKWGYLSRPALEPRNLPENCNV